MFGHNNNQISQIDFPRNRPVRVIYVQIDTKTGRLLGLVFLDDQKLVIGQTSEVAMNVKRSVRYELEEGVELIGI